MTGSIAASGNVNTLLKADGSINNLKEKNYCFINLFYNCESLTQAPELPATTLAAYCYASMFSGCISLTQAPELPATTLADDCYRHMFRFCYKLNNINVNFSEWYISDSISNETYMWLEDVASTGTFTCPTTLSEKRGVSFIPEGWTVIRK